MAIITKIEYDRVLGNFKRLSMAVVDTCSIIYMKKSGFLNLFSKSVELIIISEVAEELKAKRANGSSKALVLTDQLIFEKAKECKLPLITEDKKLMVWDKNSKIEYYNSLMVLLYLLFKKETTLKEHQVYKERLLQIAYYSSYVKEYADEIECLLLKDLALT